MKTVLLIAVALTAAPIAVSEARAQEWGGVGGVAAARGYSASPALWMPAARAAAAGSDAAAPDAVTAADADASPSPVLGMSHRIHRRRGIAVAEASAARPHRDRHHVLMAAAHHDRRGPALGADAVLAAAGPR